MITMNRVRALAAALLGVVLVAPSASAQAGSGNAVVNGIVQSEFGRPLEAAQVYITELSISVATGADGKYTMSIPAARVSGQQVNLRVRAIGMQPSVKPIRIQAGTQTINFDVKQDINRLDEVVVTGVVGEGTERSKVPFAVAHLSTEDLPVPALDPITALAGKVSGMRVASTSGRPGSTPEIQLRGVDVDQFLGPQHGAPLHRRRRDHERRHLEELGGLDIESVEVVKGAAGASLYGTRAANGVIAIKTKRGGSGRRGQVQRPHRIRRQRPRQYRLGHAAQHALKLDETGSRFCVAGSSNVASCSRTIDWMTEVMRINNVRRRHDCARRSRCRTTRRVSTDLQNVYQATPWPGKHYDALAQVSTAQSDDAQLVDATGKVGLVRFFVSGSYQDEQGAFRGLQATTQRRGRVNLDYDARTDLTVSVSSLYDNGYIDNRSAAASARCLRAQPGTDYLATDSLGRPIFRLSPVHCPAGNGDTSPYYDNSGLASTTRSPRVGSATSRPLLSRPSGSRSTARSRYDNRQRFERRISVKGSRTTTTSSGTNNGNMHVRQRQRRVAERQHHGVAPASSCAMT